MQTVWAFMKTSHEFISFISRPGHYPNMVLHLEFLMHGDILGAPHALHVKVLNSGCYSVSDNYLRVSIDFLSMGLGRVPEEGGAESLVCTCPVY